MAEGVEVPSGEVLPMRHVLGRGLPEGFPAPVLGEQPHGLDVRHVDPEGWTGDGPIEDRAVAPPLEWTEAHRILILDAYNRKWARYLEDGQSHEIEWPPTAYLWTPGHAIEPILYTCNEHDEADCEICELEPIPPDEVYPAEWRWRVQIEVYRWEGTSGVREEVETFEFMTTLMDPREVDYT
ncbi:hypothetical protein FNH13_17695 [Ornithinimicrobium ciconiae]|uniref:Uncharacterized protein n=1 Tax=Ornithinimicrobium ciconiae TaxID=2594265 RepID=A0A516GEH6_9MICO|nr:hypothetical protein [Ornithinimicrobium ciconiae]QDO89934.1 hypothetical protein FNH13_17695 [Ornithinimicrobium ciconiae]